MVSTNREETTWLKGEKVQQSHYSPGQARRFPELEVPRFQDIWYMKVVRLSALSTGRLYLPGNIPGTYFCQRLSRPQGHSEAGRIMSMKNTDETIGNRTCIMQPDYN